MPMTDVFFVFQWWSVLFLFGAVAYPFTKKLFSSYRDKGYMFSKAVGMALVSYLVYLFGTLHIAPFSVLTIFICAATVFIVGIVLFFRTTTHKTNRTNTTIEIRKNVKQVVMLIVEEVFFFGVLLFWSYIKAHEPSIRGLEKFMDYGFMQSILNSTYFPAQDMWYAGGFINYYYFGHLVTAVLTKLSGLDLSITFNLMLAALCALTVTMSFSIGVHLLRMDQIRRIGRIGQLTGGLLTAFLVAFAGNMQTIYAFTKGYVGDNVVPFWTILWTFSEFLKKLGEGMMRYWYANATRFIPFSIHEFPSYSFVVSDVHGHVMSLPFVLLAIALLIPLFSSLFVEKKFYCQSADRRANFKSIFQNSIRRQAGKFQIVFFGFLLGILLMTNALDGPIYGGLFALLIFVTPSRYTWKEWQWWLEKSIPIVAVMWVCFSTALLFLIHFDSFATGIGVNCPPAFFANSTIGPFLFESIDKCQKSPVWMLWLLWGFFWFCGSWLFVKPVWEKDELKQSPHKILKVLFLFSILLILFPEFFYVKDIYPAHFRSNTMFKLGYQAFIMWSILSAYVITHFFYLKKQKTDNKKPNLLGQEQRGVVRILFFLLLFPQLFLVSIFPIFAIRSYFGELRTYHELSGVRWLEQEYPDDYEIIKWLKERTGDGKQRIENKEQKKDVKMQEELPVIVEADGDSYTDFNHISAFTGLPTVVGWAVHEWLWRGTYDIVSPRREEVRAIYETPDPLVRQSLLEKYNVTYIIIGKLEREKYANLQEQMISQHFDLVFASGDAFVYRAFR